MKLVSTIVAALMLATVAGDVRAQVPGEVTFTARLVNNGIPLDGSAQIRLQLFDSTTSSTSLWSETHSVTGDEGLVAIRMGSQVALDESIVAGGPLFLEVTVDGQVMSPRLPIGSVPYAMMSARAAKLGMLGETDVQRRVTGVCASGTAAASVNADGSLTCAPTDYSFGSGLLQSGRSVKVDSTVVQARISGSCASGQYMRAIASTGQVTCAPALSCKRVLGASGAVSTQTLSCPIGTIVMGGGCSSTANTQILDSYPGGTSSWFCRTTTGSAIQAIAICCDVSF